MDRLFVIERTHQGVERRHEIEAGDVLYAAGELWELAVGGTPRRRPPCEVGSGGMVWWGEADIARHIEGCPHGFRFTARHRLPDDGVEITRFEVSTTERGLRY